MKDKRNKKIFFNRAEIDTAERQHCEECFEPVVFLLKDKEHEFSLGLSTVLECLAFAVRTGDLPKIPTSWFSVVDEVCDTKYSFDEDVTYYDYENYKQL